MFLKIVTWATKSSAVEFATSLTETKESFRGFWSLKYINGLYLSGIILNSYGYKETAIYVSCKTAYKVSPETVDFCADPLMT